MSTATVLNFIITDPKDVSFTEHIYFQRNFISAIKPIILHEFNHFYTIFSLARNDFQFRILIHAGLMDKGGTKIGEYIVEEFKSKPELKDIELYFMTRKADWFGEKSLIERDGYHYFNSKYLNRQDFIDEFNRKAPIYRKGDLAPLEESVKGNPGSSVNATVSQDEQHDFGIITALYDDEGTAFIDNSKRDKSFTASMGNLLRLTFKEDDDIQNDYQKPYLLSHAQKMGMVDTTYNAALLLERYNPKFLIMGGVCGGKAGQKKDYEMVNTGLKYRDVIIANNIMDIQMGKLEKGQFIPYLYNESLNHELLTFIEQNRNEIRKRMLLLVDKRDSTFLDHVSKVTIRIGDYGCGSQVINTTDHFKEQISSRNNKAMAVEMESYGIYRSCSLHNTLKKKIHTLPLVVKSVMDYTDDAKSDEYKADAAKMSYLCIRAMMPLLLEFHEKNQKQ